jgi:predicted lipid-binding transport protein (Tim44 family)
MNSPVDMTTIIFVILTLFVLYKLRSVLGIRDADDHERSTQNRSFVPYEVKPQVVEWDNSWNGDIEPNDVLKQKIIDLIKIYPSFNPHDFITGARSAYEMIITSFAKGDKNNLRQYVDHDVLINFEESIDERISSGHVMEIKIVSENKVNITDLQIDGKNISISVYFQASIIQILKDRAGTIINNENNQISETQDIWTFSKNIDDPNPNWMLTATQIKHD